MKSKRRVVLVLVNVFVTLVLVIFVAKAYVNKIRERQANTAAAFVRTYVWPEESRLVAERVRSRQMVDTTVGSTKIDLKPYINCSLNDSPAAPKGVSQNNLSELPLGAHIFAGVPFDVEGTIQLMGAGFNQYGKRYPGKVENIRIGKNCSKIHVLHGAIFAPSRQLGTKIAWLILHYSDGTQSELNIIVGQQVFDWWFPIAETGIDPILRNPSDPGTELAWVGTNPWLKRWKPGWSLRLFKTTFENPRPTETITSMDYVSNGVQGASFMAGVTIE